jgi:hypothetical protein
MLAIVTAACRSPQPPSGNANASPAAATADSIANDRPFITLPAKVDVRAVAASIVPCHTTEAELRQRLGEPSRDGILHGARVLTWLTRTVSPGRYLGVLIDGRGVVTDVYWDVPTEVPWTPTDQCRRS